jgi:predicted permease
VRGRLPIAFYLNAIGLVLFFAAIFLRQYPWHVALQWIGGAMIVCGIVALVMKK